MKAEFCSFKAIKLLTLKSNLFCLVGRNDDLSVFHFQALAHLGLKLSGILFGFFLPYCCFFLSLYFCFLTLFRSFLLLFKDGEGNDWLGFKRSIERPESGEKSIDISSGK